MEDTSNNEVVTIAKGLLPFDGKDRHAYREWRAQAIAHLNTWHIDVLTGLENQTQRSVITQSSYSSTTPTSILPSSSTYGRGSHKTVVRCHEENKPEDRLTHVQEV